MAGNAQGARKRLAMKLGLDVAAFEARIAAGEKYCWRCRAFHPLAAFNADASRVDGLDPACGESRRQSTRAAYQRLPVVPRTDAQTSPFRDRKPAKPAKRERGVRHPRVSKLGEFYAETRDGDKKQARSRVNHHVDVGLLPDPNDVPCKDCGHVYAPGERRHEYDHYLGYSAEHQLDVQSVCTRCHRKRDQMQTHCDRGHEFTPENTCVGKNGDRACRSCRRLRESKKRDAAWWRAWRARRRARASADTTTEVNHG